MPVMLRLAWLLLGGVFTALYFGNAPIALAMWIAPTCLLHVTRNSPPLAGLASVWIVLFGVAFVRYRDTLPFNRLLYLFIMGSVSIQWTLPYVLDRLLARRVPGFASALIFPLAWATVEFATLRLSPGGSWLSPAYSQYGNVPLMQLTSVTGLPGIVFVVAWFASTASWVWDGGFAWQTLGLGTVVYASVLTTVLLAGAIRIARTPSGVPAVRTATISYPKDIFARGEVTRIVQARVQDDEREPLRRKTARLQEWFLDSSRREAIAGAKIIVWPEINLLVFKEDELEFLQRAQQLAREQQIYLLMGMATVELGEKRPLENKAILLNPTGGVDFSYDKTQLVPGWEATLSRRRGDGRLPIVETPYGRVTAAICADADYPRLMRQTGERGADLLLLPANDWPAIKDLHRGMAVFRAIESGVTLLRATSTGLSTAVDPYGRTLAISDDSSPGARVMVAQVPLRHVTTVYARVGDLFSWLCVAGLAMAVGVAIR